MPYPTPAFQPASKKGGPDEVEIWFDWAFVDFWKSNYCKQLVLLLAYPRPLIAVNRCCPTWIFNRP